MSSLIHQLNLFFEVLPEAASLAMVGVAVVRDPYVLSGGWDSAIRFHLG